MERLTTPAGTVLPGREAEAAARLSRLESCLEALLAEEARQGAELARLRAEGKTKTARFRELLGQTLLLRAFLDRLRRAGALDDPG